MAKILDVYLHDMVIGKLVQNKNGEMNLSYSDNWLADSKALALCLNLQTIMDSLIA